MAVPNSEVMRLLAAAAQMRAASLSWETVAARLERSPKTLRRWLAKHREHWDELYLLAERDQYRESGAESTALLRNQLREGDAKGKRDAAKALLLEAGRHRRAEGARAKSPPAESLEHFSDLMSPGEIQDVHEEFAAIPEPPSRSRAARPGRRTKPR